MGASRFQDDLEHIRKGCKWQNKPPVNGREVTSDDAAYSFKRGQSDPRNVFYVGPTVPEDQKLKIQVLDKYTVKFTRPTLTGVWSTEKSGGDISSLKKLFISTAIWTTGETPWAPDLSWSRTACRIAPPCLCVEEAHPRGDLYHPNPAYSIDVVQSSTNKLGLSPL